MTIAVSRAGITTFFVIADTQNLSLILHLAVMKLRSTVVVTVCANS